MKTEMAPSQHCFVIAECFGHGQGGDGKLSLLMAKELKDLGVNVSVFSLYAMPDDVELCRLNDISVVLGKWQRGCRWLWPHWRLSRQIVKAARRIPCALLFKFGITPLTRFLLRSSVASKLIIIETTDASPNNKFVDSEAAELLNRSLAITTPSEVIEQNVKGTYGFDGPILRMRYWIDPDEMGLAGHDSEAVNPVVDFLYLGRFDPEKGLFELIEAFAGVLTEYPQTKLTMCGLGIDESYRRKAREYAVHDNISFLSLVDPSQIGAIIKQSKWLVLPSYHEGYPLAPLEALACSRPAILTSVGSIPEIYGGSEAAKLINPKSVTDLRQAMLDVIAESPSRYRKRCKAAKSLFHDLSSKESIKCMLSGFLNEVVRMKGVSTV